MHHLYGTLDEPGFVNELNNASDPHIEASKKNLKESIDKRNKKFGNKGDMGHVFHSTSLIGDPNFAKLQNYVGATAHNLLIEMGFDLTNYTVFITELWVQEFAKKVQVIIHYIHIGMVTYLVFIF